MKLKNTQKFKVFKFFVLGKGRLNCIEFDERMARRKAAIMYGSPESQLITLSYKVWSIGGPDSRLHGVGS